MKKSVLFSILFFLLASVSSAQWIPQNSGTTASLTDICFSDSITGWVSGESGRVLKTTNRGNTWIVFNLGNVGDFYSIHFVNNTTGWVAASDSMFLYKTSDGGNSWTRQNIPRLDETDRIGAAHFFNPNTGIVAVNHGYSIMGADAVFYKTTNGGTSWFQFAGIMDETIDDIQFLDADYGWASGSTITYTTNGGETWMGHAGGVSVNYPDLFFLNNSLGWIIESNGIQQVYKLHKFNGVGFETQIIDSSYLGYLRSPFFTDANNGWCVASEGKVLKTTNGGTTWLTQTLCTVCYFSKVYFVTQNEGWIVGSFGTIYHTVNAGTPVELTSFNLNLVNNSVELYWTTATELNNRGFEIYRQYAVSAEWELIGFEEGNGTTTQFSSYKFLDNPPATGTIRYRLKQIDYDGTFTWSDPVELNFSSAEPQNTPVGFFLDQNYPNPFNPSTVIRYGVNETSHVKLTILNAAGEEVLLLVNEIKEPGIYEAKFYSFSMSSGVYFCNLENGTLRKSIKMLLLK